MPNSAQTGQTKEALRQAQQRLAAHTGNSPLAVLELDAQLNIAMASERAGSLFACDTATLPGKPLSGLLGVDNIPQALHHAFGQLQSGAQTSNQFECAYRGPDDRLLHLAWFNSALTDAPGQFAGMLALVEDVSARVQAQAQAKHNATHDLLTGLLNRQGLTERLISSVKRPGARRDNLLQALRGLLFIDLDRFRRINDEFGHASGDLVLREVTKRLLRAVRAGDVVARFGGDQFVVLLDADVDVGAPQHVCDRVAKALERPCKFKRGQAQMSACIGVALQAKGSTDTDALLTQAEAAMLDAKRAASGSAGTLEKKRKTRSSER